MGTKKNNNKKTRKKNRPTKMRTKFIDFVLHQRRVKRAKEAAREWEKSATRELIKSTGKAQFVCKNETLREESLTELSLSLSRGLLLSPSR